MREYRKLAKALREARVTAIQWRMAVILLQVNGITSALDYVVGLKLKTQPLLMEV